VQAHDSADETVLSEFQDRFSPNELARFRYCIFAHDLDEALFWHLCSDADTIVDYRSINWLRHKRTHRNILLTHVSLLNMYGSPIEGTLFISLDVMCDAACKKRFLHSSIQGVEIVIVREGDA
jgi:hypothetical protein